jgi:hypothetical protein
VYPPDKLSGKRTDQITNAVIPKGQRNESHFFNVAARSPVPHEARSATPANATCAAREKRLKWS